jgi:hypothetical protein
MISKLGIDVTDVTDLAIGLWYPLTRKNKEFGS